MKNQLFRLAFVLVCALPVAFSVQAQGGPQSWAVGLRVGEPMGLSIRKYFGEDHAFDVNVGTYGALWGVDRKYGGTGHYKNVGLAVNANYLWLTNLSKSGNLKAYYGFGGQINSRRNYPDRLNGNYESKIGIGGSGLAGVELFLADSPLSVFTDLGLYIEVLPVPVFTHVQGGIGVRFNF
ncbi:MAG: hypothetical protein LH606_08075 [Cytophagaceae bacterium]|nr:hypothetical protein [Cytophagaceae bacterium]